MIDMYSLASSRELILPNNNDVKNRSVYKKRYLIRPKQEGSFLAMHDGKYHLFNGEWGLVPRGRGCTHNPGNLYNAHATGIFSKTSFRMPVRENRAIIPLDGYYWVSRDGAQMRRISCPEGKQMYCAGIFEMYYCEERKQKVLSYSMITTQGVKDTEGLGTMMPAFLFDDAIDTWMNPTTPIHILDGLLRSEHKKVTLHHFPVDANAEGKDLHQPLQKQYTLFDHLH